MFAGTHRARLDRIIQRPCSPLEWDARHGEVTTMMRGLISATLRTTGELGTRSTPSRSCGPRRPRAFWPAWACPTRVCGPSAMARTGRYAPTGRRNAPLGTEGCTSA